VAASASGIAVIEWWVYLAVLGGLLVVGWLVDVIVKRGIATPVLGDDGRTSTSKLQAALWTFAVLWALISLLAGAGVEAFEKALSGNNLREEYLLLLGGPFAAAIAAKRITVDELRKNPKSKSQRPETSEKSKLSERMAEVVSNDEGGADLGDFQYFAFTLVTLTYFTWAFIKTPAAGLPPVPATLLVLVDVSQATYVGKKGLLAAGPGEDRSGAAVAGEGLASQRTK